MLLCRLLPMLLCCSYTKGRIKPKLEGWRKIYICCICLAITIPSKVPSRWNLWQYSPDTMHNRVLRTSFRCQQYFIRRKWFVHFQPCKSVLTRGRCGAQLALTCVSYIVIYTYPHQALIPLEMERQNGPMQLSCEQSARHWAHRIIDMNSIR